MVFLRHTLPGELVEAVVTSTGSRFLRADAVAVLEPAPERVSPPCPYAGPGRCGGCDWQHASLDAQRAGKASVVTEQLARLARLDVEVRVEALPGSPDGLGWRTRVRYAVDEHGVAGLRRHRSHELELGVDCRLAAPGVRQIGVAGLRWPGVSEIEAVASGSGERALVLHPSGSGRGEPGRGRRDSGSGRGEPGRGRRDSGQPPSVPVGIPADVTVCWAGQEGTVGGPGRRWVLEPALGRVWRVDAAGFWQVHPGAAETLAAAVLEGLDARPGQRVGDLYSGVGLFAAAAAEAVGPSGVVVAVEADTRALANARRNLHDLAWVRLLGSRVEQALAESALGSLDRVVLDPPRAGAGARVVHAIAALGVPRVVYVACDPAALARDVAGFIGHGYQLEGCRAFDLFPMTHHVECVAVLSLVS